VSVADSIISNVVDMRGIDKRFEGVHALKGINFTLRRGEVHALVGENGAGKSTLVKLLCGVYSAEKGEIIYKDRPVHFVHPSQAQSAGIIMVPQEINLVPYMKVYENIFLGKEHVRFGFLQNKRGMIKRAKELLEELECTNIDPEEKARNLSVAQQQVVCIARALAYNSSVLVLDEPTAAITEKETAKLFSIIRSLKAKGVGIIYISHRLDEIGQISDRITILRDGCHVGTFNTNEISRNEMIRLMVGRELRALFPKTKVEIGDYILKVRNISYRKIIKNVSFDLRAGEILGLTGLMGSKRTELVKAVFGCYGPTPGTVEIKGKILDRRHPCKAMDMGIGYITEDRKNEGLFMQMSVADNVSVASLEKLSCFGIRRKWREKSNICSLIEQLRIKTPGPHRIVKWLSGGNQQKVVLARWLTRNPSIYILDEPTRGIDVGAKAEIHELMGELLKRGAGIILISSELPEVLGMSDRILVMREGQLVAEFGREEATQELIMKAATGGIVV